MKALFDAVYASPDDDVPRLVLADALLESGDVRGEFIATQIAMARGEASPDVMARARELERQREMEWAGRLSKCLRVEYRRGFPWVVHVRTTARTAAEWATVGVVIVDEPRHDFTAVLDTGRSFKSLERLSGVDAANVMGAAKWRTPKLRAIDLLAGVDAAGVKALSSLPTLAELSIGVGDLEPRTLDVLWSAPLLSQLTSLRLRALIYANKAMPLASLRAASLANPRLTIHVEGFEGTRLEMQGGALHVSVGANVELVLETLIVNVPSVFPSFTIQPSDVALPLALQTSCTSPRTSAY